MIHTILLTHRINKQTYIELQDRIPGLTTNKNTSTQEQFTTHSSSYPGINRIALLKKITTKNVYYGIEILCNPKILLVGYDDIELATFEEINEVQECFNQALLEITGGLKLPSFFEWTVKRIDYAVDVKVAFAEDYVKLFKKGDKPRSSFQANPKDEEGSLYLKAGNTTTINFYSKFDEVARKENAFFVPNKERISKAKDILRFEVQCNYRKTNYIKNRNKFDNKQLHNFLDQKLSKDLILYYYDEVIGPCDYLNQRTAEKILNQSTYSTRLKNSLNQTLKLIAQARSVWKAREQFEKGNIRIKNSDILIKGGTRQTFNNHLKKLRELGLNPVLIPANWKLDQLSNLRPKIVEKFTSIG